MRDSNCCSPQHLHSMHAWFHPPPYPNSGMGSPTPCCQLRRVQVQQLWVVAQHHIRYLSAQRVDQALRPPLHTSVGRQGRGRGRGEGVSSCRWVVAQHHVPHLSTQRISQALHMPLHTSVGCRGRGTEGKVGRGSAAEGPLPHVCGEASLPLTAVAAAAPQTSPQLLSTAHPATLSLCTLHTVPHLQLQGENAALSNSAAASTYKTSHHLPAPCTQSHCPSTHYAIPHHPHLQLQGESAALSTSAAAAPRISR